MWEISEQRQEEEREGKWKENRKRLREDVEEREWGCQSQRHFKG